MKFLVGRCASRRVAKWFRSQGHEVLESRELGPDPGDRALLERAVAEACVLVTIDTDFGELIYVEEVPHAGSVDLNRASQRSGENVREQTGQADTW